MTLLPSQLQEQPRQAGRDIQEGGLLDDLIAPAQPAAQDGEQHAGYLRPGLEVAEEVGPLEQPELAGLLNDGVGRAGFAIEQGQLAEKVVWAEDGQDPLPALVGGQEDLDPARFDEIEAGTGIPLDKDDLALGVAPAAQAGREFLALVGGECAEERHLGLDYRLSGVRAHDRLLLELYHLIASNSLLDRCEAIHRAGVTGKTVHDASQGYGEVRKRSRPEGAWR